MQERDLAAADPDTAALLLRRAREGQSLWDYLVEANRVTPTAAETEAVP